MGVQTGQNGAAVITDELVVSWQERNTHRCMWTGRQRTTAVMDQVDNDRPCGQAEQAGEKETLSGQWRQKSIS